MFDIKLLANKATVKKFDNGEIICTENIKKNDEIYILLIGKVNIYLNYKQQNEIMLDTIEPGNLFGETNLSDDELAMYTAVAKGASTVAVITKHVLLNLARQNYSLFLQIIDLLCERNKKTQKVLSIENYEKNRIISTYKIDKDSYYNSILYPVNHKQYNKIQPLQYNSFIIKQQYICPHCHEEFEDYCILTSKLISEGEMSCDLRKKYKNFEPLWYEIKTCPNCYFSGYEGSFSSEIKLQNGEYEKNLYILKNGLNINFNDTRDINQVFTSYYLALMCSSALENKKQIESKLWLSLSWLYNDIGDRNMEIYAAEKAYDTTNILYNECDLSNELSQTTLMIIGSLGRKLGRYNDAILSLSKAIRVPNCKSVYKRLIEIEIDKIREEKNK